MSEIIGGPSPAEMGIITEGNNLEEFKKRIQGETLDTLEDELDYSSGGELRELANSERRNALKEEIRRRKEKK